MRTLVTALRRARHRAAGWTRPAALSGGNMQKLILGRACWAIRRRQRARRLIVANQPTWGLDIGAVAYVHQQLLDACATPARRCC
jgi:ABC-type uncharacterized transport system ATPase subunit